MGAEDTDTTESEQLYIRWTNLAKLRIAKSVLGDVLDPVPNGLLGHDVQLANRLISRHIIKLEELDNA